MEILVNFNFQVDYACTYARTYVRTCIRTYVRTYQSSFAVCFLVHTGCAYSCTAVWMYMHNVSPLDIR